MPPSKIGSMNRRWWALVACVAWIAAAAAADFPSKPLKMIVPFPPGGLLDNVGRALAPSLSAQLGQPVVVENRPGAAGIIGADAAVKAAPDGHTLLFSGGVGFVVAPLLNPGAGFDPLKDLTAVSRVTRGPSVLVAAPSFQARSVEELIALAKAAPGRLAYGSPGVGTPQHVAGELLKSLAGIDIVHVPYRGAVFTDIIGGRVPIGFQNMGSILPTVRDGKLRALAVTSLERSPMLPDLPSVAESGFPGFEAVSWFGLMAPAGTPAPIVDKVYRQAVQIATMDDVRDKLAQLGFTTTADPPDVFGAIIKADIAKWAKVIRAANIKSE